MDFPRLLYRPGTAWALELGRFDVLTVADADALDAALAAGWSLDQAAALVKPAAPVSEVPADDAPPTRDELLQKAAELGITVDKRWGDARLLAAVNDALKG